MKMTRISEHVWSLRSWLIIPFHVWLVVDGEGVTLVDAGIPFMSKGILSRIESLNAGPLQRIVLTHGHSDHVGAIATIMKKQIIPVFAHQIEIPYMEGDQIYPRRKKAEQTVVKGTVQPLPEDELGRLKSVAGLTPYHTPGHSPGHVVYYHEQDGVMLAGDLFTSKKGKLHHPMSMFTANMQEALASSTIVGQLQPKHLEVCHGNPVINPADHLEWYLEKNKAGITSFTS